MPSPYRRSTARLLTNWQPRVTPAGRIEYADCGQTWVRCYELPQALMNAIRGQDLRTTQYLLRNSHRLGFFDNFDLDDWSLGQVGMVSIPCTSLPFLRMAACPSSPEAVDEHAKEADRVTEGGMKEGSVTVGKDRAKKRGRGEVEGEVGEWSSGKRVRAERSVGLEEGVVESGGRGGS